MTKKNSPDPWERWILVPKVSGGNPRFKYDNPIPADWSSYTVRIGPPPKRRKPKA